MLVVLLNDGLKFRGPNVTKILFTTLVRRILEYGSMVGNHSYQMDSEKLESVQKQVLLFALGHFRGHYGLSLTP